VVAAAAIEAVAARERQQGVVAAEAEQRVAEVRAGQAVAAGRALDVPRAVLVRVRRARARRGRDQRGDEQRGNDEDSCHGATVNAPSPYRKELVSHLKLQLLPDQAVHLATVGASLGLAHHESDDRAHRLLLAAPELLDGAR